MANGLQLHFILSILPFRLVYMFILFALFIAVFGFGQSAIVTEAAPVVDTGPVIPDFWPDNLRFKSDEYNSW